MKPQGPATTVLIANPGADLYGSDRMVLETVAVLVAAGWRTVVTVPGDGPLIPEIIARGAEVEICRTPVVRKAAMRPLGMIELIVAALLSVGPSVRLIKRLDADVVYVNTVTPPLWILLARLLRRACVCHVHEAEASASGVVLKALNAPLLLARSLIVNSEFSQSVVIDAIPRLRARSVVVHNAVVAPPSTPPRPMITGPCRLLYIGRLSPRKGPQVAIEAVAMLHRRGVPVSLDLVGAVFPGYEWFERELHEQVSVAGLGDVVTFHGFQQDVWPYVARADVMVVPSTTEESFGNAAVEAVLGRRPVVVSAVGGLPEATAGFDSVTLVQPGRAEELADAIEQVLRSWDFYAAQADVDAERAARRYSLQAYGDGVLAVLNSLDRGDGPQVTAITGHARRIATRGRHRGASPVTSNVTADDLPASAGAPVEDAERTPQKRIVSKMVLVAALIGFCAAAGCSGSPHRGASSSRASSPMTSSVSAALTTSGHPRTTAPATGKTSPLPSADPAPVTTVPTRQVRTLSPQPFASPASFGTMVFVRITRITHGKVTDTGPGALTGRSTVVFDLQLRNGSSKTVDVNTVQVAATYGRSATPAVPANDTTAPFVGSLAAGKATSGTYAFAVPDTAQDLVDLTVSYRADVPTVLLRGSAR